MKNLKLRKILLTICSAMLLVTLSVGATFAYLTSTTGSVTNTFTVGKVAITLDEAKVDEATGKAIEGEGASRVTENKYKVVPSQTYDKDPTVHVAEGSEACYVFVKVENGLMVGDTNYETTEIEKTIAAQMKATGWTLVEGMNNVYAYKENLSAGENAVVFETFTLGTNVTADTELGEIKITAYAVQSAGINSAADAWKAAPASWN